MALRVCTFEQAKEMNRLGITPTYNFVWSQNIESPSLLKLTHVSLTPQKFYKEDEQQHWIEYPAYLTHEIGSILPVQVKIEGDILDDPKEYPKFYYLRISKITEVKWCSGYFKPYDEDINLVSCSSENLAECLTDNYLWLKHNRFI